MFQRGPKKLKLKKFRWFPVGKKLKGSPVSVPPKPGGSGPVKRWCGTKPPKVFWGGPQKVKKGKVKVVWPQKKGVVGPVVVKVKGPPGKLRVKPKGSGGFC